MLHQQYSQSQYYEPMFYQPLTLKKQKQMEKCRPDFGQAYKCGGINWLDLSLSLGQAHKYGGINDISVFPLLISRTAAIKQKWTNRSTSNQKITIFHWNDDSIKVGSVNGGSLLCIDYLLKQKIIWHGLKAINNYSVKHHDLCF